MSYVDGNLMAGESVVYRAKIHWFIFVPGAIVLAVGLVMVSVSPRSEDPIVFFGVLFFLTGFILLLKALITKISTELAVTSKRVIAKFGLISRSTIELNHGKVESMNVDQTIMGRIFGFGTVVVNGTGGGKTPIPNIDAPLTFRRNAMETIDASQVKQP
jgi:uncharacterized membrane protein YdbT with pleckstrin-like domain